jgi:hypothetical protein
MSALGNETGVEAHRRGGAACGGGKLTSAVMENSPVRLCWMMMAQCG